jgi:uncharacterized membrane protein YbhN (UPF0104 family)
MSKHTKSWAQSNSIRLLFTAVLLLAATIVLIANRQIVARSVVAASNAQPLWLVLAMSLMILTFAIAAAIYMTLALHRLKYRQTLLVEIATSFVNRLLPSGIGGLGLHGIYLYKRKHTTSEATVVVSINNLIGMVAHTVLLIGVIWYQPNVVSELRSGNYHIASWRLLFGVLVLLGIVMSIPIVRQRIVTFSANLIISFRKVQPIKIAIALVLAIGLTGTYTLILFCCMHSLGIQLSLVRVFIVFSVGMLASTATPTPGGLVGAEAGLFAALLAYGTSSPLAGAAVVLYRLITYWIPLLPGLIALWFVRNRALV